MNSFTENLQSIIRGAKRESKIIWGNFFSSHHEVELFQDRIVVSARESVTPLKLQKAGDTGNWVIKKSKKPGYQGKKLVVLHPFHMETNLYHLVYRDDTKSCPQKVTRCEYCKILFTIANSLYQDKREETVHLSKNGERKMSILI